MNKFSKRSLSSLKGVDEKLIYLMSVALITSDIDFTIVEGLRSPELQAIYLKQGKSQTLNSKHLKGLAVDIYPYPIPRNLLRAGKEYTDKQIKLAEHIVNLARKLKIKIIWGGSWSFGDLPHFELI